MTDNLTPSLRELAHATAKLTPDGDPYEILMEAIEAETKSMRMIYEMTKSGVELLVRYDAALLAHAAALGRDVNDFTEQELDEFCDMFYKNERI